MDRNEDLKLIRNELGYLGIKEFPEKGLADLIKSGKDNIQIDGMMQFSQYGKKQDMEYNIFLKKYDQPNLYHPYLFQATLKDNPERSRAFQIKHDAHFTMQDAFNMLNGRAVQKLTLDMRTRKMENLWFQLDLNRKDVNGNSIIDRFKLNRNEDKVIDSLKAYPIKQMMNPPERVRLILSLLNGNVEPVSILHAGKELKGFVSASPKQNTVQVHAVENGQLLKFKIKPPSKSESLAAPKSNVNAERKSKGRSI